MPKKIVWCYGIFDSFLEELASKIPELILLQNLPSKEFLENEFPGDSHNILVLDDLFAELTSQKQFGITLVTRFARHRKLSVFCLNQNQYEMSRSFCLNCNHIFQLYPGRDLNSLRTLSSSMYPGSHSVLVHIWRDIEKQCASYPYMYICCKSSVKKEFKILTSIFPFEDTISYIVNDY